MQRKQSAWRDQTAVPDLALWKERFRKKMFYRNVPNYLASKERDEYLSCKLEWIDERLAFIDSDLYKLELIQVWQHARHDRVPQNRLLGQIEKCRISYAEVQEGGRRYPWLGAPIVDDFVFISEPRRIIKFLIVQELLRYYKEVLELLQKNRRTGGLRNKTEAKILGQVERGEQLNKTEHTAQNGFRWLGAKVNERIELLYSYLIKKHIHPSTSLEQLRIVFSDQPVDQHVIWISNVPKLLLLIEALIDKEFLVIPPELVRKRKRIKELAASRNRGQLNDEQGKEYTAALHEVNSWLYARIKACFLNKKGQQFTALKHARSDVFNKQKYLAVVDEFDRLTAKIASY